MPLGQLADPVPPAEATADSPTDGPHHRTVQWVHQETTPEGQNLAITNTYVELGLGLNRWDADRGDWVLAQAEFEQTADGYFIARQTQHQVILSPDLAVEGAMDFLTPDGQRLRSTPLGIALLDTQSGMSVMLGEITSCQAEWLAPGEAIYRGAFEGLNAHVRYRLSLFGFEQDILGVQRHRDLVGCGPMEAMRESDRKLAPTPFSGRVQPSPSDWRRPACNRVEGIGVEVNLGCQKREAR